MEKRHKNRKWVEKYIFLLKSGEISLEEIAERVGLTIKGVEGSLYKRGESLIHFRKYKDDEREKLRKKQIRIRKGKLLPPEEKPIEKVAYKAAYDVECPECKEIYLMDKMILRYGKCVLCLAKTKPLVL